MTVKTHLFRILIGIVLISFSNDAVSQQRTPPEARDISLDQDTSGGMQEFIRTPIILNMDSVASLIQYPEEARNAGIQGDVVFRVLVGIDGTNVKHKIIQSVHPLLDAAVEQEVSKLRFEHAIMDNGKPCAFWVSVPFRFRLTGEDVEPSEND